MEIRLLKYFLTLAREENISRAAAALYITQPTLSRQLVQLEEELGVKLFERGKRKITLTEEGILLRRRAEEMVELAEKTENEFRVRADNIGGVIAIGAAETKAAKLLPLAISSFKAKYPDVSFDIYSDTAEHVKERLDGGLLDLGLLVEPGDIEKYDFLRLHPNDVCGLLVSSDSPVAKLDGVRLQDIGDAPVLTNKRREVRSFYRQALGDGYDRLNSVATFNLINNAALFALENMGYVFTIEGCVENYRNEKLKFVPFTPKICQSPFLIWKKYQPKRLAVQKFIEEIDMLLEHKEQ